MQSKRRKKFLPEIKLVNSESLSSASLFPRFFLLSVVDCGPPPHSGHLHAQFTSTGYNSTATYSCEPCYRLISTEIETETENESDSNTSVRRTLVRYCDATGSWNGPVPVCQGTQILLS